MRKVFAASFTLLTYQPRDRGWRVSSREPARRFFLTNTRLLERHLFHHLFEDGSREAVLQALLAYQTEANGFAYGLEPDKRTSNPQPIDQEQALSVLADSGPDGEVLARHAPCSLVEHRAPSERFAHPDRQHRRTSLPAGLGSSVARARHRFRLGKARARQPRPSRNPPSR